MSNVIKKGSDLVKKWIPDSQAMTKLGKVCSDIFNNKGEQLNKHSNVVQFDTNINSSKNLEAFSDMNNLSHIVIFVVGVIIINIIINNNNPPAPWGTRL